MFMMPITRSAPRYAFNGQVRDLSRAFDRLLDEHFAAPATADAATRLPAIDVRETDQHYTVLFDLPGVAREDVKVTIEGKRVSVEARGAQPAPAAEAASAGPTGERVVVRERSRTAYARSLVLPVEVDDATSQAKLENGVLTLTLIKKQKAASQLQVS